MEGTGGDWGWVKGVLTPPFVPPEPEMDTPPSAGRRLVSIIFLLGCSLWLCSGALLPPSYPPDRYIPATELAPAPGWSGKRSIVVADDAAFRERSKMLTAMERQKWLNSYMQKLLVVNPD
uniref:Tuberoinfundibular peptide of 39 residues n=1 Tax=Pelusios castaneus TaxID=367368 RepID=A0A8C8RH74_9SAUR